MNQFRINAESEVSFNNKKLREENLYWPCLGQSGQVYPFVGSHGGWTHCDQAPVSECHRVHSGQSWYILFVIFLIIVKAVELRWKTNLDYIALGRRIVH